MNSNPKSDPSSTERYKESWEDWPAAAKQALFRKAIASLGVSRRLVDFALLHRSVGGAEFGFDGHEYLKGIYLDESPRVVIEKAAQMGATEYAISRCLHFCDKHGGRVIYYFPTDTDVSEFSRDRFGPAIKESPYLAGLVKDTNTANLKQIGGGSIYFRGTTSRTRMTSVPADLLVFDELDTMVPENVEFARKRLGHSSYGWELDISTPTFPGYGIDQLFQKTDQRYFLLRCGCGEWHCLEEEFLAEHGNPSDPRQNICFVKGEPGRENLVCRTCGRVLDPSTGEWVPRYPERPMHGYHVSKFLSPVVSEQDKAQGLFTRAASLLQQFRDTPFPSEFYNSELGLPYLGAEDGLSEDDLLSLAGSWRMPARGKECVMGVDQGNGLHIVIKEPHGDIVLTVRVHHEPQTDPTFSHLDHFMEDFDVRYCVIDALPNTHAARAFAKRFPGRVWCSYYGAGHKGTAAWEFDKENTRIVSVNRTEALDAWRDAYKMRKRRIPRVEDEVSEYVRQMTNVLRKIEEDPETGQKKAVWVRRGPDHYAHADSYAEIALKRINMGLVHGCVIG